MAAISGIIITLNEEAHITECIASLRQVCNEVIVVDSESKDRTRQLAEAAGATVITQPYLGDGPQKNVGLRAAKNDWIFSLDADERLTPELVSTIKSLDLKNSSYDGYAVRRRNLIGDRWIKVCGWYPDYFVRLYNHRKTRFSAAKGHARVTSKNIQKLKADLVHFSYRHVGELFSKGDRFSTRGAKMLFEQGRHSYFWSPMFHGLNAFFKKYILKFGFLGGVDGLTISLSAGMNSYLKWAKLKELQSNARQEINKKLWEM